MKTAHFARYYVTMLLIFSSSFAAEKKEQISQPNIATSMAFFVRNMPRVFHAICTNNIVVFSYPSPLLEIAASLEIVRDTQQELFYNTAAYALAAHIEKRDKAAAQLKKRSPSSLTGDRSILYKRPFLNISPFAEHPVTASQDLATLLELHPDHAIKLVLKMPTDSSEPCCSQLMLLAKESPLSFNKNLAQLLAGLLVQEAAEKA